MGLGSKLSSQQHGSNGLVTGSPCHRIYLQWSLHPEEGSYRGQTGPPARHLRHPLQRPVHDPAMRSKGGKWHLKVDDMKRIFPRAHSKAIEVNVDFEPSETKKPADNFKFNVKYALTHGDGDGDEKGTLMITRQKEGDMWTTKVKTTGEPMPQGTIIPKRIRNMDWEMSSDRQTKFNFDYTNPDMNRNFHVKIDRVPGKQMHVIITNGDRKHDLTFKVQDFDLSKVDGNSKIQKNIPALYFETKTKYSLMGGALQGTIKAKFENGQLNLENELNGDKIELRVKVIPGESADIEA